MAFDIPICIIQSQYVLSIIVLICVVNIFIFFACRNITHFWPVKNCQSQPKKAVTTFKPNRYGLFDALTLDTRLMDNDFNYTELKKNKQFNPDFSLTTIGLSQNRLTIFTLTDIFVSFN